MSPRQVASAPHTPSVVANYLLPEEKMLVAVRRHPAVLFPPGAAALGAPFAALAISLILRGSQALHVAVWILAALVFLRLAFVAVGWTVNYLVFTQQRVVLLSGVFTRQVTTVPLTKITDVKLRRYFAGRLVGYGDLIIESADGAKLLVDYLPYPEQVYLELAALIFPRENPDGENPASEPSRNPDDEPGGDPFPPFPALR
jgi:membrane protein YdbS with pleckstrin-like domain